MKKVIVIGIDGMDSALIDKFEDDLPNLKNLKIHSSTFRMESVFPPDSTPAWASIYTGLNPAQHGIINFVNTMEKAGSYRPMQISDDLFRGNTFWDIASKASKNVCVVLPFNIYPGWSVNGLMICRTNRLARKNCPLTSYPKGLVKKYPHCAEDINLLQGYISRKKLPDLYRALKRRTCAETNLSVRIIKNEAWDLFFTYFSALDAVQHFFWNFFDETHPNYPGPSEYKEAIKEQYILIDRAIGELMKYADSNTSVIVLSDHGHGLRPTKVVNINEVLRQNGLLTAKKSKAKSISKRSFQSGKWLKSNLLGFVKKFGVNTTAMRLARLFPVWKKILASPYAIDWKNTLAYVTDLSTVKSYSYGGIRLNNQIEITDRDRLVDEIIEILRTQVKHPVTQENLVKKAMRREELYDGEYLNKYPEIVVELKEGYGLGWEIEGPLIDTSDIHNIQPGSHKRDTAVFLMHNVDSNCIPQHQITLMDIAPIILRSLEINLD